MPHTLSQAELHARQSFFNWGSSFHLLRVGTISSNTHRPHQAMKHKTTMWRCLRFGERPSLSKQYRKDICVDKRTSHEPRHCETNDIPKTNNTYHIVNQPKYAPTLSRKLPNIQTASWRTRARLRDTRRSSSLRSLDGTKALTKPHCNDNMRNNTYTGAIDCKLDMALLPWVPAARLRV